MLGIISSVYTVTYDSLYPLLITEGNMGKAYSISSTMESLLMIVTPLSAYLYHKIGIAPLFFIDCVCYTIAAIFEIQIRVEENYVIEKGEKFGLRQYKETFKEGIAYLKLEPGLMAVAVYFMFSSLSGGANMIIGLPYFRGVYGIKGEYIFMIVGGAMMVGRLMAGVFHYRHKLKPERKFSIAFIVYPVKNEPTQPPFIVLIRQRARPQQTGEYLRIALIRIGSPRSRRGSGSD